MSDEYSKNDAIYSFRIPEHTKAMTDKVPADKKADLNERLRITVARFLHDQNFDASLYLGEK